MWKIVRDGLVLKISFPFQSEQITIKLCRKYFEMLGQTEGGMVGREQNQ